MIYPKSVLAILLEPYKISCWLIRWRILCFLLAFQGLQRGLAQSGLGLGHIKAVTLLQMRQFTLVTSYSLIEQKFTNVLLCNLLRRVTSTTIMYSIFKARHWACKMPNIHNVIVIKTGEQKHPETRWVLSETKAVMSPPVCHWMESNFFVEAELIN